MGRLKPIDSSNAPLPARSCFVKVAHGDPADPANPANPPTRHFLDVRRLPGGHPAIVLRGLHQCPRAADRAAGGGASPLRRLRGPGQHPGAASLAAPPRRASIRERHPAEDPCGAFSRRVGRDTGGSRVDRRAACRAAELALSGARSESARGR
ncbi:hypothetical protein VARIO8X_160218 [Burkholderiales bacterium 8X]|nr:hypothetical protein VARIO8X_160218 [Burkholderiales bacterium 8X]